MIRGPVGAGSGGHPLREWSGLPHSRSGCTTWRPRRKGLHMASAPAAVRPTLPAPARPRPRAGIGVLLALAAWCGFLLLYGIRQNDLYRTEGLRALLGAELLRGGSWAVPTLYGEPLL